MDETNIRQDKKKDKRRKYSDFAYDDAFRTMVVKCDDLVLPFLNFMFGESYDKTARIIRSNNEHFKQQQGGEEEKRITDSAFEVILNLISKKYHIECESGADPNGAILVRLFEYDAQIALEGGSVQRGVLQVTFPHTGVLYLRNQGNRREDLRVEIITPGGSCSYPVKALNLSDIDLSTIYEKQIFLLLPFYLFRYEKQFYGWSRGEPGMEKVITEYQGILERLDDFTRQGLLSVFSKGVIINLMDRVAHKLTMKYKDVQEKVGDLMGGKVMDLEVFQAERKGREEGEARLICKMLDSGKTIAQVSAFTGKTEEEIKEAQKLVMQMT